MACSTESGDGGGRRASAGVGEQGAAFCADEWREGGERGEGGRGRQGRERGQTGRECAACLPACSQHGDARGVGLSRRPGRGTRVEVEVQVVVDRGRDRVGVEVEADGGSGFDGLRRPATDCRWQGVVLSSRYLLLAAGIFKIQKISRLRRAAAARAPIPSQLFFGAPHMAPHSVSASPKLSAGSSLPRSTQWAGPLHAFGSLWLSPRNWKPSVRSFCLRYTSLGNGF